MTAHTEGPGADPKSANPRLAVVVTARDAASDLPAAVASALGPRVDEVVIAVDPSDGPTARAAHALARNDPRVRVVDNPGGRTPTGLNAALGEVTAPIVARLDAHTRFGPGYLSRAVTVLGARDAAVVGGRQRPVGHGPLSRAIGAAMTSRAGAGGARHRTGTVPGPAETAYLGVFVRSWLDRVGGYDPTLDRNQDYELCHRIRRAGGVVWFDPDLVADYQPRDSWRGLARQYHDFGRWKRHVMTTAPGSIRPRQLAPPALVAGLVGSLVAALVGRRRWLWPPAGYVLGLATAAARAEVEEGPPLVPAERARVAAALAVMHLFWGGGFWRGRPRG